MQAQQAPQAANEVRALNFPFEPRASTPDDELLEVARTADVNLFVDATEVTEKASQVPTRVEGKQNWYLENLLSDIGAGRRLAWEIQEADRALLFSSEPNIKELRQLLLQGEGVEVVAPKIDEAAFSARLTDYLKREHGWRNDGDGLSKTILIADLPADLKHEMLVRAQQGALNESLGGASMLRKLIGDETWRNARVVIQQGVLGLVFKTPTSEVWHRLTPSSQ